MCVFRATTMMHAAYSQMVQQIYTLYICACTRVCMCVREREEENPGMEPLETSIQNPGTCEGGQAASRDVVEPPFPYTDGS